MKKEEIHEFEIIDLAFGGKGIAKAEGLIIFIDKTFPGQIVEAQISKKKNKYAEAKLIKVIKASPIEIENDYQTTPGAPWITLPIEKQHEYKKKQVFELFQKFSGISLEKVFDDFLSSPKAWHYRNKMEYSFGPTIETGTEDNEGRTIWSHTGFGLGSKKRGQYWLVENLEKPSGMFDKSFEEKIPEIYEFCKDTGLRAYNQRTQEGFFRNFVVRKSFFENSFLINLVTKVDTDNKFDIEAFATKIKELYGNKISGIFWSQSDTSNDSTANYSSRKLIFGKETITEQINGLAFDISLDSFFQTNPASAEHLYEKVSEYAKLKEKEKCLDLYCGTGTISQIMAHRNESALLTGVEIAESAVADAKKNAYRNEIKNVHFICADVKKFLKENHGKKYSTIVLDPPRSGIAPKSLTKVLKFAAPKLIYVSCNPATMARDTETILEYGYKLTKFSMVDQFPHTSHVECVGKFVKINESASSSPSLIKKQ